jgi:hypothetical protein
MPFEIVGDITQVETIAMGRRIKHLAGCADRMAGVGGASSRV